MYIHTCPTRFVEALSIMHYSGISTLFYTIVTCREEEHTVREGATADEKETGENYGALQGKVGGIKKVCQWVWLKI